MLHGNRSSKRITGYSASGPSYLASPPWECAGMTSMFDHADTRRR